MFSFFKRKPAVQPKAAVHFVIDFDNDDGLRVKINWPDGLDDEALATVASDTADLLCLMGQGSFLPLAQQAVCDTANSKQQAGVATSVLTRLRVLQSSRSGGFPASGPVVSSLNTFKVRGDKND